MSKGVNKVIIIGCLGQDPDSKVTSTGKPVCNVSIATSEFWKDKTTGKNEERTEWHKAVFFDRLAEVVATYLKKGSKVYIEGSLRTRKWQDKDGRDCYTTEIVAKEMQMLDGRGDAESAPPARTTRPSMAGLANTPQQAVAFDDFDDDIPF